MVCLEPNSDFCAMARQNCKACPSVQVINQAFEEWDLKPEAFDAVLAASSIHWIPAEIAYTKASRALKPDGHLILLWNKEPQPFAAIQAALAEVYQRHAPALGHTENRATQDRILSGLGQTVLDSGRFHNLVAATLECSLTTTHEQYIELLSTYSPYHTLDHRVRSALFSELKQCLVQQGFAELQLSYLSAVHIAQKLASFGQ